ncbi:DNA/RNA non-specific endonuclease [Mariniblastus sp.]|nr:DNA/RNA non-specific endonuclease [Mariniblastus sp.]
MNQDKSKQANEVEITIPIQIRVRIGEIQVMSLSASDGDTKPTAADESEDDDLLFLEEASAEDFLDREGFDTEFLGSGFNVPRPVLTTNESDILEFDFDGEVRQYLDYQHFSVLMSESRRMCRLSACNIDGESSRKKKRKGWRFDPRIPKSAQIMKECYGREPKFSRGHMTRRLDPVWGSNSAALTGNTDSMHVTNAVPQIQPFNGGVWLALEDYALDHTREDEMRVSVVTGPFLHDDDPVRFGVKIPKTFWKIIAFIHDDTGELSATGYTMSQASFIGENEFVFGQHENHQRPINEIEARAGISFGGLADIDPLRDLEESKSDLLATPEQIIWA